MQKLNNEKRIILFTFVAHFLTHFYELLFPALAVPLMLSLNLNLEDVLQLGFLMYLLYGLAALPWGFFADRYGNRLGLIIFFVGSGTGALLTAVSGSKDGIMLSLATIGFFASIYHPAGMGLISRGVRNRGMALGINGVAGNLGLVSAPFTAGLFNWLFNWQATYALIGVGSILWGIILLFTAIDENPAPQTATQTETTSCGNKIRYFALLCLIMTFAGLSYRANSIVMPAYLEFNANFLWNFLESIQPGNSAGGKTMAATLLASSIYIISIFGQILGGKLADSHDLRWLYLIFHSLSLPFILLMGFWNEHLLLLAACLYVFFSLGMQPIENSLVAKYTPPAWRSTGYGIKFILVFGIGSLAVYLVGWIKNLWSLNAVYFFAAGIVLFFNVLILYLIWISREEPCRNTD